MSAAPVPRLSVEEYLELDRRSELPIEYHDGEVFTIEGASVRHGQIQNRVAQTFLVRLRDCDITSLVRIRINPKQYVYPDQVVFCGKPQFLDGEKDTLANPKVIIEVLSPRTADYDYGSKFALYRQVASLEEYVLIAQSEPKVEIYRRSPDGRWILTSYPGIDAIARVESLGIEVPLAEIYAGVEF